MKDYSFKIKVADILQDSSHNDSIQLVNKFSTDLPQLIDPWISANIFLQGMDHQTLLLQVDEVVAPISVACDVCGEIYTDQIAVSDLEVKCFFGDKDEELIEEFDDIILWDDRTKTVDVENFLVESISLSFPVVNCCEKCQKLSIDDQQVDEVETGNIIRK